MAENLPDILLKTFRHLRKSQLLIDQSLFQRQGCMCRLGELFFAIIFDDLVEALLHSRNVAPASSSSKRAARSPYNRILAVGLPDPQPLLTILLALVFRVNQQTSR
jgi:hypothetical protein